MGVCCSVFVCASVEHLVFARFGWVVGLVYPGTGVCCRSTSLAYGKHTVGMRMK